jgi:hypothetical protein
MDFSEVIMNGRLPLIVILHTPSAPTFGHLWSGSDTAASTDTKICFKGRTSAGTDARGESGRQLGARMKLILLLFVLLFAGFPKVVAAQQWSTLPVDALVSMNTSTPGTALTSGIANAGTISSQCTVGSSCAWQSPTDFEVGANSGNCSNLGAVQMTGTGGTLYPAQSLNYNNMAHNDANNNTNAHFDFSGAPAKATSTSVVFCVTTGAPYISNGDDWDILGIWLASGQYYEVQLNNACNSSGQFGVRIENGHPTSHSPTCIPILPQHTYYMMIAANFTAGTSTLNVYTPSGSLVGTTSASTTDAGSTLTYIQVGNNEGGSNAGTFTLFQNIMVNWTTAPNPYFWMNTSPSAGVLAPGRATAWNPGVPGGIPTHRTQCATTACGSVATNGASSTSVQINAALASAPANSYVSLPAGTYSSATGCITFGGVSNVTLRGAGANQTFLAPTSTSGCAGASVAMASTSNSAGSPQNGPVAVSGMVNQGSNTITLASVPNLTIGNPIVLDQLDPTCDNGGIFVSGTGSGYTCTGTSPGVNGPYNTIGGGNGIRGGSGCSNGPTGCYHQQQIVMVTSCNGVTTVGTACTGSNVVVGFYPGLHMPNWSTANMFAWWATKPIQADGVEDLSINSGNNPGANSIEIENCQGCWVKGVSSQLSSEAHVQLLYANLASIRNNYFFLTQNTTTVSYGVECFSCSDSLVENNIFQSVTTPEINNGPSTGNVWGYNFTVNDYFTSSAGYSIPARGDHAAGDDMNLTEGNISNGATGDNIHGTGNMMTFFRNYYPVQPACWQSGSSYATATYGSCNSGITTMQIFAFHRFYSVIGNVLGTTDVQTTYCNGTTSCSGGFTADNSNVLGVGYGNTVSNDSNTVKTTMLWGNADPVTGFTSPRFNCSEVPAFPAYGTTTSSIYAVQLPYLNPCPASDTLPASFYYSSKPSWWPSSKPWPIIGPDVTDGNVGGVSGLVYTNPAEDCYLNVMSGNPNGTSAVLSFNEASCYTTSVGGPTPLPPSGLTATPVPVPPS